MAVRMNLLLLQAASGGSFSCRFICCVACDRAAVSTELKPPHIQASVRVHSCGYALVCLIDENCLLADNVLQIIAKYTHDNILRDGPPAEVGYHNS